jgi:hypothetical protein
MGILDTSGGQANRAVESMVGAFRDIGLDGKASFASAETVARRALADAGNPDDAIRSVIRKHRRGTTAGGFLTGLGGFATLPLLLPTNIFEFYVQATRMVGAIAKIRGYDLGDQEVRARVLASLVGEESGEILDNVGLGPIAGAATRRVAKRLPKSPLSEVTKAIGVRLLRRFGLRSARLFGKAIPGLGGVIGAVSDRRQLGRIAQAAKSSFPERTGGRRRR